MKAKRVIQSNERKSNVRRPGLEEGRQITPLRPEGRKRVRPSAGEYTITSDFWTAAGIMAIKTRDPRGRRSVESEGKSIPSEGVGVMGPRRMKLKITLGDLATVGGSWRRGIRVRHWRCEYTAGGSLTAASSLGPRDRERRILGSVGAIDRGSWQMVCLFQDRWVPVRCRTCCVNLSVLNLHSSLRFSRLGFPVAALRS
jgi:hypothetical protein